MSDENTNLANKSASSGGPPRPGMEHQRLEPFVGTFQAKVRIHFGPDQVVESTGTMVNSWHLDGLYLNQDYQGDPNDGPFPNFEGKGYWEYNISAKHYEGFWIDNASSMMQTEVGHVSGQVWIMEGSFTHPETGQRVVKKSVITLVDENQHRMDSYFSHGNDPEKKTMEIEYTRV